MLYLGREADRSSRVGLTAEPTGQGLEITWRGRSASDLCGVRAGVGTRSTFTGKDSPRNAALPQTPAEGPPALLINLLQIWGSLWTPSGLIIC